MAALIGGAADVLPPTEAVPRALVTVLNVAAIATVFGLIALLVGQFAGRLRSTTHELANVIELSTELAQTLDPREIGDLTARFVALATGADECGICYWDEAADLILTYGYYPPERRGAVDEAYALDDYPATRAVLERQLTMIVNDTDPSADPAEVAYLQTIGHRSMATLPLVAKGRALGAIEATSRRPEFFDERRIRLAQTLAARGRDGARERPVVRGAPPPGLPRQPHRPGQPGPVPGPGRARGRPAARTGRRPDRGAVPRPGRLQDDQREPRSRRWRPAPQRRGRPAPDLPPGERHGRPAGR